MAHRMQFSCGDPKLDAYLQHQASQDMESGVATVYVLRLSDDPTVVGYYALCPVSVEAAELSPDSARQLGSRQLARRRRWPAYLLARLAVDLRYQRANERWGTYLVGHALERFVASEIRGAMLVVDAKEERLATYYERRGFIRCAPGSLRLFLPRRTAERLIRDAEGAPGAR